MIVAFDYGTKNIGVAITDENEIFSFAKCSISTDEYSQQPMILLTKVPQIQEASLLIVGHPRNLKNQSTVSTQNAEKFSQELQQLFPSKKVLLFDERFTSQIAKQVTHTSKHKTKKRTLEERSQKDMIEAQILLQDYLQRRENEV
ncbi:MAG TPA: Holliday junction resolvase RuvX [Caldisericia bacterium]|mgnify:CR=1 FL=1|jgi:putative Holliday junction resolvase|nr:Holliday junction resolvase RuvX [Caldisericia bacterium]